MGVRGEYLGCLVLMGGLLVSLDLVFRFVELLRCISWNVCVGLMWGVVIEMKVGKEYLGQFVVLFSF